LILYIESNFVLEIALGREDEATAREILDRAEEGLIQLVVPIFSLCEPYSTVSYRARKRAQEFGAVERQLQDLGRGDVHRELVDAVATPLSDVLNVAVRERETLEDVVGRLLRCARILPFSEASFDAAKLHQVTHGLDASDALIYASVLLDAQEPGRDDPKQFVTRNSADFDREAISEELAAAGCELGFAFADAIRA
jgi:predicted nucleic acid-binding protein